MLHLSLGCVLLCVANARTAAAEDCQQKTLARILSPSASFVADIIEYYCDFLFAPSVSVNVTLSRADQSDAGEIVLSVDTGGNLSQRPSVEWTSQTDLEIKVKNNALIGIRKKESNSISIKLIFNPDDKIARARFLEQIGRATEWEKYDLDKPRDE